MKTTWRIKAAELLIKVAAKLLEKEQIHRKYYMLLKAAVANENWRRAVKKIDINIWREACSNTPFSQR